MDTCSSFLNVLFTLIFCNLLSCSGSVLVFEVFQGRGKHSILLENSICDTNISVLISESTPSRKHTCIKNFSVPLERSNFDRLHVYFNRSETSHNCSCVIHQRDDNTSLFSILHSDFIDGEKRNEDFFLNPILAQQPWQ